MAAIFVHIWQLFTNTTVLILGVVHFHKYFKPFKNVVICGFEVVVYKG